MEMDKSSRQATTDIGMTTGAIDRPTPASKIQIEQQADGSIAVAIETKRLIVEPVRHSDAENYHRHLFGDPQVMEKFATGEVRERAFVDGRINTWVERWKSGDPFGGFAIRLKSGEFVGHVVLGHGDEPGRSEIAYLIRADKWGQGYGSEAVRGVVQGLAPLLRAYGFPVEGGEFKLIDATARADNPGSGKILSNLGMKVISTSEKFNALREHYQKEVEGPNSFSRWETLVFGGYKSITTETF